MVPNMDGVDGLGDIEKSSDYYKSGGNWKKQT